MSVMTDVLAAMPVGVGVTPKEAWRLTDKWSRVSVRHALRDLCRAGLVVSDGPDCHRVYRKEER